MFQQEVEKLLYSFSSQTGAFIVTSWWEVIAVCLQIPKPTSKKNDLPFAHILCPAVPFKTAPALECLLPNISSTLCFLIRRVLLRLVARCLPFRESAS